MLKSLTRISLIAAVTVPLLAACSSPPPPRPVSNLQSGTDAPNRASPIALKGNSGIQIYGTIDAGYGYSSSKSTIRHSDGTKSTRRSSNSGVHSW